MKIVGFFTYIINEDPKANPNNTAYASCLLLKNQKQIKEEEGGGKGGEEGMEGRGEEGGKGEVAEKGKGI